MSNWTQLQVKKVTDNDKVASLKKLKRKRTKCPAPRPKKKENKVSSTKHEPEKQVQVQKPTKRVSSSGFQGDKKGKHKKLKVKKKTLKSKLKTLGEGNVKKGAKKRKKKASKDIGGDDKEKKTKTVDTPHAPESDEVLGRIQAIKTKSLKRYEFMLSKFGSPEAVYADVKKKMSKGGNGVVGKGGKGGNGVVEPETHLAMVVCAVAPQKNNKLLSFLEKAPDGQKNAITSIVAADCEFVGVGADGKVNALARASVVNYYGQVIYDKYVRVPETVTDYRTAVSGIMPHHLTAPETVSFKQCQKQVADVIKGRILVGHSINHDLHVLQLTHPYAFTRDTAHCKLLCPQRPRALKVLVKEKLNIDFQGGSHSSVEDSQAVLAVYKTIRKEWEGNIKSQRKKKRRDQLLNKPKYGQAS